MAEAVVRPDSLAVVGVAVGVMAVLIALATLHVWRGGPPSEAVHQGIGLFLFALFAALLLWLWPKGPRPAQEAR